MLADAVMEPNEKTELNSHANMIVVGRHAYILNYSGRTAQVSPFTPEYESLKEVPIVDAAVAYDCPIMDKSFILVFHNALIVPSMDRNLMPPFILREAGLEVNDTPKIQVKDPTIHDNSIYFPSSDVRITLSLNGIFSYFPCLTPTRIDINESDLLAMTPDGHSWDPHCSAYADYEENMMDWNGQMIEPKDRTRILLQDLPEDELMIYDTHISSIEMTGIDVVVSASSTIGKEMYEMPPVFSKVASILSIIFPVIDPVLLSNALE